MNISFILWLENAEIHATGSKSKKKSVKIMQKVWFQAFNSINFLLSSFLLNFKWKKHFAIKFISFWRWLVLPFFFLFYLCKNIQKHLMRKLLAIEIRRMGKRGHWQWLRKVFFVRFLKHEKFGKTFDHLRMHWEEKITNHFQ